MHDAALPSSQMLLLRRANAPASHPTDTREPSQALEIFTQNCDVIRSHFLMWMNTGPQLPGLT